jgi:dephospho-CoA kinase
MADHRRLAEGGEPSETMLRIALTGGIATGKSYVAKRLVARGIPVIDADTLAHGVMAAGTEATAAIVARFGSAVAAADGSVDRAKLGPIVFADPQARRDLEQIVHPAVYRAIAAAVRTFELSSDAWVVAVDVPLLFETGHAREFDRVIVTACDPATQVRRLKERGLTEEAARQRIAAQLSIEEKAARADFVIRTDGTFEETDQQISGVLAAISNLKSDRKSQI